MLSFYYLFLPFSEIEQKIATENHDSFFNRYRLSLQNALWGQVDVLRFSDGSGVNREVYALVLRGAELQCLVYSPITLNILQINADSYA